MTCPRAHQQEVVDSMALERAEGAQVPGIPETSTACPPSYGSGSSRGPNVRAPPKRSYL